MKYKVIAFDFDGTLVDSRELIYDIARDFAYRFLGREISDAEISNWRHKDVREIIATEVRLPKVLYPLFFWYFRRVYLQKSKDLAIFSGMEEIWAKVSPEISSDVSLAGVVTSNSTGAVGSVFARYPSLELPRFITGGIGLSGKSKALAKFIRKNSIDQREILYVGDEVRDIVACREVGIDVAAVSWGFNSSELLADHSPNYLLERPKELQELLA